MNRTTLAVLFGVPAFCLLGAVAACASILGFEDLRTPGDAASSGVSVMAEGGITPVDASATSETSDDSADSSPPEGDAGCGPSQAITLDAIDAAGAVSASGVDSYSFSIAKTAVVVARVRTSASIADVEIAAGCDGSGAGLPTPTAAPDGVYTRGTLQPGTDYLRIAWGSTVATSTPYTFDVMNETLAANTCAKAAPLTTAAPITGNTFEGPDTSSGCPPVPVYGQLFYSVTIPANAAWEVTGTPGGAWTIVLEVLTACTSTTCALPTAVSPTAGAPANLELNNTSAAANTFLIGVSASAGDGASGGGAFTISAQALSKCPTESASCDVGSGVVGLCCGGICEPLGVQNSCGATCAASCSLAYEVCTAGACACPSSLPNSCPPSCVDTSSDPNNCGHCNTHCTTTDPHAVGVECSSGECRPVCATSYPSDCSGVCTNLHDDNNNCGTCGTKCTGGRTCSSKSCQCLSAADPDDCGGASCTNLKTDNNNCGKCGLECSKVNPNATGTCNGSGECTLVCNAGYKSCTAGKPCVDVMGTDDANCGNCNTPCATSNPMMTAACTAGTCVVSCQAKYTCPNACTDKETDVNNCGTCGHQCPTPEGGVAACDAGVCQ